MLLAEGEAVYEVPERTYPERTRRTATTSWADAHLTSLRRTSMRLRLSLRPSPSNIGIDRPNEVNCEGHRQELLQAPEGGSVRVCEEMIEAKSGHAAGPWETARASAQVSS